MPIASSAEVMRAPAEGIRGSVESDRPPYSQKLSFAKGRTVFTDGDPAKRIFEVLNGTLIVFKLLSDGRRQIFEIVPAGWLCGFAKGDVYDGAYETLTPATVMTYSRAELEASDPARSRLLHQAEAQFCALHDLSMALGRKRAHEKLATFLMRFVPRRGDAHCPGPKRPKDDVLLRIPLSRAEIADHLGLTLETVSRELSALAREGLIKVGPGRGEIRINDVCQLCAVARTGHNE